MDIEKIERRGNIATILLLCVIALTLVIAVYLAMLDGLSIWKTLGALLLILLVIGAEIVNGRRTRKLEEEN